jgi:hypothetical protein
VCAACSATADHALKLRAADLSQGHSRVRLASAVRKLCRTACVIHVNETQPQGGSAMSTITTHDGVEIFYKDWGPKNAQPIVFHHGWPLSADDWDAQMLYFVDKDYRVVALDRRTRPVDGR